MSTQTLNSIASKELYMQYSWYKNTFPPVIQKASDDFFLPGFTFELIGISKNINALQDKSAYFVTKIMIDKQYDMFFRSSEDAIGLILESALGKANKSFNLNRLTDLEAKIITSFNDYMFNMLASIINPPPVNELHRTNFDMIHLTFIVKNENKFGKFIVSVPQALLNPDEITPLGDKFDKSSFPESLIDVKILIGSTRFSMHDLKNLDIEDLVVFDNSDTKKMVLVIDDYEKEINLNPNLGLITPIDNNGGDNMGAKDLWDSIEVEMNAEFDAVRITLGDLKNIEEGNVVDLTSIYDNKVTLHVEDKPIARGELVIINDRYGVRITELLAGKPQITVQQPDAAEALNDDIAAEPVEQSAAQPAEQQPAEQSTGEDEFDYSDFELDDEDI